MALTFGIFEGGSKVINRASQRRILNSSVFLLYWKERTKCPAPKKIVYTRLNAKFSSEDTRASNKFYGV